MKSLMVTSRHIYFLQCSSFGEVDFIDLETRFLVPFLGVLHLGEADLVDLEVLIYFLQCSSCHEVDFVDLEARVYLFPLSGVLILVKPILLTSRY